MSNLDDRIHSIINQNDDVNEQLDELEQEPQKYEMVEIEYTDVPTEYNEEDGDRAYDYVKTRKILHSVLDRGMSALEGSLVVAQQSEHPRAYEVSSSIMKNISEISKDLMNLHDKNGSSGKEVQNQTNVQNNYYANGSTEDDVNNILDGLDDKGKDE